MYQLHVLNAIAKYFAFLPRDAMQSVVLLWHVVCLSSVTMRYRDHIGWNSSKIISRLVGLGCSLCAYSNILDLLQRGHPKILARIGGVMWKKVALGIQKH